MAEPNLRRAIDITQRRLGYEDLALVPLLDSLATVFMEQKAFEQAEAPLRRAVSIQERAEGPKGVNVAPRLDRLAMLYYTQKRYAEAEPLYRRSLAIWESAMGANNPELATTLDNLAVVLASQEKFEEAEPAVPPVAVAAADDHGGELNNLAMVLEGRGQDLAERQYKQAIAMAEKLPDPSMLAFTLHNYASLLRKLKREVEAKRVEARLKAIEK